MRVGDILSRGDMREYKLFHVINYGNWEVWRNSEASVYREMETGKIKHININGEGRNEYEPKEK